MIKSTKAAPPAPASIIIVLSPPLFFVELLPVVLLFGKCVGTGVGAAVAFVLLLLVVGNCVGDGVGVAVAFVLLLLVVGNCVGDGVDGVGAAVPLVLLGDGVGAIVGANDGQLATTWKLSLVPFPVKHELFITALTFMAHPLAVDPIIPMFVALRPRMSVTLVAMAMQVDWFDDQHTPDFRSEVRENDCECVDTRAWPRGGIAWRRRGRRFGTRWDKRVITASIPPKSSPVARKAVGRITV
jgi:hypothetical protein